MFMHAEEEEQAGPKPEPEEETKKYTRDMMEEEWHHFLIKLIEFQDKLPEEEFRTTLRQIIETLKALQVLG